MTDKEHRVARLHQRLGHKPLNRTWAKVEILLGLAAAGLGLLLGVWALSRPAEAVRWESAAAALALFVLGGYLALAGHRSHLYQSANELTAYLAELIQNPNAKGHRDEHPR
jgi:hypothetical protein